MSFGKHVVGIKTQTYLTAVRSDWDPYWIVTLHTQRHELHATKGWCKISHEHKNMTVRRLPSVAAWRAEDTTTFERTMPARKPRGDFTFRTKADRMRALMRHRERRRDLERAVNLTRMEAGL